MPDVCKHQTIGRAIGCRIAGDSHPASLDGLTRLAAFIVVSTLHEQLMSNGSPSVQALQ